MKNSATLSIAIIAIALLSVSCNKRCDLESEDISSGAVFTTNPGNEDQLVVIYPSAGNMTESMAGFMTDTHSIFIDATFIER